MSSLIARSEAERRSSTARSEAERRSSTTSSDPAASRRGALIVAAVLVVVLQRLVPYGQQLLYPFTLLSTWVHEMGHGVAALLVGGQFQRLLIYADASGMASIAVPPGLSGAVTSAAGLLAPPLVGAVLLLLGRRAARLLLLGLLLAMGVSLVLWVRTQVGWLTVGGLAALIGLVAVYGGAGARLFFVQLLGVLLGFDTVARMDYLFMPAARVGGAQHTSDIASIAAVLGGPYQLWGGLLAGVSLLLLVLGLWGAWRQPRARASLQVG